MPIFDYQCIPCGHVNEFITFQNDKKPAVRLCEKCGRLIYLNVVPKLPGAPSFKIKGLRAANGYGLKSIDTYGVNPVDGRETGASFTSNRGGTVDHNQGQVRKVEDSRNMAERKADNA